MDKIHYFLSCIVCVLSFTYFFFILYPTLDTVQTIGQIPPRDAFSMISSVFLGMWSYRKVERYENGKDS